jgi:hypothetical protein
MLGAGIVLALFGAIGLLIGNGLRGSGGDVLAFIEFPFLLGGGAMFVIGVVLCLIGLV